MSTDQLAPMWRLTDRIVRSTLVTAWRLATSPTRTSPPLAKATTDGVVRAPSALGMTVGSPPSRTATTELVVPRSMPTARAMRVPPDVACDGLCLEPVLSLARSTLELESCPLNLVKHRAYSQRPQPRPPQLFAPQPRLPKASATATVGSPSHG